MREFLQNLTARMAARAAKEREEQEKSEAEERERKETALLDFAHRIRGEKPTEQPATEEPPEPGPVLPFGTGEDAEAKENIKEFIDFIRK